MNYSGIKNQITNNRRIAEITGVVLTALGKFILMDFLQWKFIFIFSAIVGWTAYVIYRSRQIHGITRYWGFRIDNFRSVAKRIMPFGIVAIVSFCVIGFVNDTINFSWHIIPVLILYPVWGVIQQFLVIALVAGNLKDMDRGYHWIVIILVTALLFGVLHYPFLWLMLGTFVLAIFYGIVFLRERNVYAMGLFHGWLGGLFFYTVVDRDPFAELFPNFM